MIEGQKGEKKPEVLVLTARDHLQQASNHRHYQ